MIGRFLYIGRWQRVVPIDDLPQGVKFGVRSDRRRRPSPRSYSRPP